MRWRGRRPPVFKWLFACACAIAFCNDAVAQFVSGTGFFITHDGFIVTNDHVVHNMASVTVRTRDGSTFPAEVVSLDEANDLAILKISGGAGTVRPLAIRPSLGVPKGSHVFTIGFPVPSIQGPEAKVTEGIVSSLSGPGGEPNNFQVSVSIQPGNSGGPLIDSSGAVVGIVASKLSAKVAYSMYGFLPENVNYAVKSDYLLELAATIPNLPEKLKKPGGAANLPLTSLVEATEKSVVFIYGPERGGQAPAAEAQAPAPETHRDPPPAKPRYELGAEGIELQRRGMSAFNEKRYADALYLFGQAADRGNTDAQVDVGYMYEQGLGVGKDMVEALRWYKTGAAKGNAIGESNLGYMYRNGFGTNKNGVEAEKWFRKAAEQGLARAQYFLGSMYLNGDLVAKNFDEARQWLGKAAAQGEESANVDLGYMYQNGLGVPKDYAEAEKWYRLPAEKGNATAIANLKVLQASIAAEEEQRRAEAARAAAAKAASALPYLVGTVDEVNAKYGFVTVRTGKTIAPDTPLVFEVDGRETGGRAGKQAGHLVSATLDGANSDGTAMAMPAVGSRVYLNHP
ncbi:MAG TPA: bifunctional trypsin-like peptidase domain-containing/SEL1-like repeat protein [Burkholderiaceae bacterium]